MFSSTLALAPIGTLGVTGLVGIMIFGSVSAQAAPINANIPPSVAKAARSTSVLIELPDGKRGSGVLIENKGGVYAIATNGHVVCRNTNRFLQQGCQKYDKLTVITPDQRRYPVTAQQVNPLKGLDLALVKISSNQRYSVALLGSSDRTPIGSFVYTSGFPARTGQFNIGDGQVLANARQRLENDRGGYTMVYDASTEPGMSGGGVFNQQGQLVAIHGQGDRYQVGTEVKDKRVGEKIGLNRGIPLARLLGAQRESAPLAAVRAAQRNAPDELLIVGLNRFIAPDPSNPQRDRKEAIQALTQAIALKPNYAQAYFLRGYIYYSMGEHTKALQDFDRALQLQPTYNTGYTNRGNVKAALRDKVGALADYDRSLQLRPLNATVHNNRGVLKHSLLRDSAGSLSDYNQAIAIEPNNAIAYYNRALLKNDQDDSAGALADYNRAIQLNPRYAEAYNNRGLLKSRYLEDHQGGLADIEQALALDPTNISSYGARALLKYDVSQDAVGAIADYSQAIVLATAEGDREELVKAYNGRSFIKFRAGDGAGAEADVAEAIRLDDRDPTLYVSRGLYRSAKSPQLALADYNLALKLDPNLSNAYILRGLLKDGQLNDPAGALADYDRAIQLRPKYAQGYRLRAQIKMDRKDYQGALQDYDRAITYDPRDVVSYFKRGLIKSLAFQDAKGAVADFDRAIALNPKNAQYWQARSYAKESLKDLAGALQDADRAVQLSPKVAALYLQRGYLRQQLQNIPGALADYNQAIQLEPENPMGYYNRGVIKLVFQKDQPGAIADYKQAAALAQKQGNQRLYEILIGQIKKLEG
jgi:tetratricopeptide (TPR) repeat protein